ncbi:hypothetical protein BMR07_02115 [Methylococcaceae bacterium CS1]|nr:hypothetical protein BMR11_04045 [Methylococcaceae bacterium CS5]TXL08398.1 hypothetical protein BMR07_02115 [Methylococcaceae bacterium CS1]TXL09370.1 hypothetical protein BMR09_01080 [Methylococcaceae bacterium CS3]
MIIGKLQILYIPANVLPIMSLNKVTEMRMDTIMSGIINLANIDMVPIAIIVLLPVLWFLYLKCCYLP